MNRASWPGRALSLVALLSLALLGSAGCEEDKVEDCFEPFGTLSQVTTDTLITDHLDAAVSPDGTRILFTTDYWGGEDLEDKTQRDIAIVNVPAIGDVRGPVERLTDVAGAARVLLPDVLFDFLGNTFDPFSDGNISNVGELAWVDERRFVAVIETPSLLTRMYLLELDVSSGPAGIRIVDSRLVNDGALDPSAPGAANNNQFYYLTPAVSPDGQWVAYTRFFYKPKVQNFPEVKQMPAIFAHNLVTNQTVRVTNGNTIEQDPTWSPDGRQIAFTSNLGAAGANEVFKVDFDPARVVAVRDTMRGPDRPFTDGRIQLTSTNVEKNIKLPVGSFDPTWLADGRIVYVSNRRAPCTADRRRNLWVMGPDGSGATLFHRSEWDDHFPSVTLLSSATEEARRMIVFSSRTNPVEEFNGEKDDLYLLRF